MHRVWLIATLVCGSVVLALAQAPATQPAATSADLVLHLKLDGNATDSSGQEQAADAIDIAPAADRTGRAGGAVHFNGKTSQIVIDPPPMGVGQAITVALWVKQEKAADPFVWVDVMDGNGKFTQPIIGQDDGYHVRCWQLWGGESFIWHRMGEYSSCWTKKPHELNRWYHVAASFDGSMHRLYVNGQLAHEAQGFFKFSRGEPIRIGAKGDETTPKHAYFTGDLDDIRIYNRALSAAEIAGLAK